MLTVSRADRYTAQLVESVDGCPRLDGLSAAQITHALQRNKFPLVALGERAPAWLAADATFRAELTAEADWYVTQRREYQLVRDAWRARGIDCLMIKSAGNRPSFPHTSDNIDIAVRPQYAPAARQILRELGYVEVRSVEERWKRLFRKFHDGRCVSAIHVHEQVAWLVGFMDEEQLWSRMRPSDDDPDVNIPSPEDAILINLAHACYENKILKLNDVARVRYALRTRGDALDWCYMERTAASRGWLDGLAYMVLVHAALETVLFGSSLIADSQLERLRALATRSRTLEGRLAALESGPPMTLPLDLSYWYCKRLYYRKILMDPTVSLARRWRDVGSTILWGIKLKSRLRPQPGMIVSLSGPDGAGKTAHARALVDALKLCEVGTDYVWSRGGSSGIFRLVSRVLRKPIQARTSAGPTDVIARRRQRLNRPVLRFIWAWLVALDQIATYNVAARLAALRGRAVILDRYVFDTAVEMDVSLPKDATWSREAIAAMLRFVPRPHVGYVLDVSPATASARKSDEEWHADIDAERRRYRNLAHRFGLHVLSTDGPFASANDRLVRDVIMSYMAGFETWVNGLFLANPSQNNVPDQVWVRQSTHAELNS
jgi:thymidylate kinase